MSTPNTIQIRGPKKGCTVQCGGSGAVIGPSEVRPVPASWLSVALAAGCELVAEAPVATAVAPVATELDETVIEAAVSGIQTLIAKNDDRAFNKRTGKVRKAALEKEIDLKMTTEVFDAAVAAFNDLITE
ncbi:MAG: hypothetical protein ACPGVG_00520 [Mycobacterium sp.]